MKKNLSLAGFSLVAMGLLMGSCVSKRKYMDAQATAAERYRTDSTEWANRTNTMQQNITSLEQKTTDYQKQVDSYKTSAMTYQKRWDNLQTTYTQQNTSTEQLHQEIHAAIDEYVEASNVESRNGKIYVNLPEKMLFTPGSSTLSTKGKQALDKLAAVLASNENVEVDIVTTAAYYSEGTATASASMPADNANVSANDKTANPDPNKDAVTDKTTQPAPANVGDPADQRSGEVTAKKKQDPVKKSTAATKAPAKKTSTVAKKSTAGDKSITFKSTPKKSAKPKSTAPSWNLNVARSTAIVRQLTQTGLPKARIVLTGPDSKGVATNEWANNNKGYQIVLSPKMDSYYQKMQEGQGSTSMR